LLACTTASATEVSARLAAPATPGSKKQDHAPPAVIWLKSVQGGGAVVAPTGKYTLLQKDKMFTPHLLVIPVGSSVNFPNADPFFHNVFSLFDGRRFDLGLYEAGSARSVMFSREGVSYIFCNIHPDMSAVVLSLSTPYSSIADARGLFHIGDVPEGDYDLHVWVEGYRDDSLNHLTRRVHISSSTTDLGEIQAGPREQPATHLNKFGRPYQPETKSPY
jgi:plastocyanin